MKITTTETVPVPPPPPRVHMLELDDNELAVLRYFAFHAPGSAAADRFLDLTRTEKLPLITDWSAAFGTSSKSK